MLKGPPTDRYRARSYTSWIKSYVHWSNNTESIPKISKCLVFSKRRTKHICFTVTPMEIHPYPFSSLPFPPSPPFCFGEKKIFHLKHGTQSLRLTMNMKNKCSKEMYLALCRSLKCKMQGKSCHKSYCKYKKNAGVFPSHASHLINLQPDSIPRKPSFSLYKGLVFKHF